MMDPTEYDAIASRLESDLNERFPRIAWEVDSYSQRDIYAWAASEFVSDAHTTPEEFHEWAMGKFRVNFSVEVGRERLLGKAEVDNRLLAEPAPDFDAVQFIMDLVSRQIIDKIME